MSYVRTKEIRDKQSKTMLERTKTMDYVSIVAKSAETRRLRGTIIGRKPTKEPEEKLCTNCLQCFVARIASERRRKFCSRKCYWESKKGRSFLTPEQTKKIDKSYMQSLSYRESKMKPDTKEYRKYNNRVNTLTRRNYIQFIELINPQRLPRTKAGIDGGYQLDHIKPIRECFDEGIAPEEAARPENLRMLTWKENLWRNRKL